MKTGITQVTISHSLRTALPSFMPLLHYPPVPFWLVYIRLQIPLRLGGFSSTEIKASFPDSRSLVRFTHSQNTFVGKKVLIVTNPSRDPLAAAEKMGPRARVSSVSERGGVGVEKRGGVEGLPNPTSSSPLSGLLD